MVLPMFAAGILGGWSVENFAVTAVMLSFGVSWYAKKHGEMEAWMMSGAVGVFLGFLGLLAAPGNWVRYGEQGTGKGLLRHIGNQIAGNGEMILYLIPAILLLLLVWRILKKELLKQRGGAVSRRPFGMDCRPERGRGCHRDHGRFLFRRRIFVRWHSGRHHRLCAGALGQSEAPYGVPDRSRHGRI